MFPDRQRPASLALRLTLLIGASTTVLFLAFGWFIQESIGQHFAALDAGELEMLARKVDAALSADGGDGHRAALQALFPQGSGGEHASQVYVARRDGQVVFSTGMTIDWSRFRGAEAASAHIAPQALRIWQADGHTYRGAALLLGRDPTADGQPFRVVVAKPIDFHLGFLEEFQQALWATTLIGIVVTLLVVRWAVHQGHAPLRRITMNIRRISTDRLHVRLSPSVFPVELTELATSFNAMLDRIEEAFAKLSNFSADIAHELRTPITNLMTQTQVALSGARQVEEYREILYSSLEEYERMAQMIGDMLFLAKADNGELTPSVAEVDVVGEVKALFEYFEAWCEERRVQLRLTGGESALVVMGDPLMLRRAISNLLTNAIRHTAGAAVTVDLSVHGDEIRIGVDNPSQEIAPEHLARLFDRFYRIDPSRQRDGEGTGLGLSIVKSIVAAHGGQVEATWHAGVARFLIRLPRPSHAA